MIDPARSVVPFQLAARELGTGWGDAPVNAPRVKLTELREYRSERTGNTYFSGYLGKARVVMLRDDRAECTGKEVARWSILLEEPEPRDGRENRAQPGQGARGGARTGLGPSGGRGGRPGARQGQNPARGVQQARGGASAADRAAGELMRESGIDPGSEMSRDELPF
jgi:hypothetical protein